MAKALFIFAALLILIGVGAYAASGAESVTALIPAFVGIPVGICGFVARAKPASKAPAIVAMLLALLAIGGSLSRLIPTMLSEEGLTAELKYLAQGATTLVCLALLVWAALAMLGRSKQPG